MNAAIFSAFSNHLQLRLSKGIYTTEDSVRYSFFAAVLANTSLSPADIVLEFPHNTICGAEIDTYIPVFNAGEVIIEFKYDRAIPSKKNPPLTQKAGKLFGDIRRLLAFRTVLPAPLRLFVYLTDQHMATHMTNN
jgi:hypothetical protein